MTLPVHNETAADITIALDDGTETVTVPHAEPATADLDAAHLRCRAFQEALIAGDLTFVDDAEPTAAQHQLGRAIFPALLHRYAGTFIGLHTSLGRAREHLARQREAYNRTWSAVEELLIEADASAAGVEALRGGAAHFLNAGLEEAAAAEIEAELEAELAALMAADPPEWALPDWAAQYDAARARLAAAHEGEDTEEIAAAEAALAALLAGNPAAERLAEWLPAFDELRERLKVAKEREATARRLFEAPYERLLEDLEAAHTAFDAADPGSDIGAQIPPW